MQTRLFGCVVALVLCACHGEPSPETPAAGTPETGAPAAAPGTAPAAAPAEGTPLPERRLLEARGNVLVDGAAATAGTPVTDTASVETGPDGHAVITIGKGSMIEVRANTKFTFGTSKRAKSSIKLVLGALWSFLPDGSSFEIETPNAVAGVRGTTFYTEADAKGNTYICACTGNVAIDAANKKNFSKVIHSPNEGHKAFEVVSKGKKQKVTKAPMKNHTKEEAAALMPYLEQVK